MCYCGVIVNCDFLIEELGQAKLLLLCASMCDVCIHSYSTSGSDMESRCFCHCLFQQNYLWGKLMMA